jgi:hypothetical protein
METGSDCFFLIIITSSLPSAWKFTIPISDGPDGMIFNKLGARRKGDEIKRIF